MNSPNRMKGTMSSSCKHLSTAFRAFPLAPLDSACRVLCKAFAKGLLGYVISDKESAMILNAMQEVAKCTSRGTATKLNSRAIGACR